MKDVVFWLGLAEDEIKRSKARAITIAKENESLKGEIKKLQEEKHNLQVRYDTYTKNMKNTKTELEEEIAQLQSLLSDNKKKLSKNKKTKARNS